MNEPKQKLTRAKPGPETKAKLAKASGHSAALVEIAGMLDDLVARRLGFGVTPDDLELDTVVMDTARKALTSGRAAISITLRVDRSSIFVDAFVSGDGGRIAIAELQLSRRDGPDKELEERPWAPQLSRPDDPLHSALFGPMFNVADL